MKPYVFGESVQGFSHQRKHLECQDSCKWEILDDGTAVIAVADGHGSSACPYSADGSALAVEVFCDVMKDLYLGYNADLQLLPTYLNREGDTKVAQSIEQLWKSRVERLHLVLQRELPRKQDGSTDAGALYRLYGSTLLGLVLAPGFLFAFQLGDGDIVYADDTGTGPVIRAEKFLGVESHSLCAAAAWKNAVTRIRQREEGEDRPYMFFLSTDGFANSYVSDEAFLGTCTEYFAQLRQYGAPAIEAELKLWLEETSRLGCGDDITVVIACRIPPGQAENLWEDTKTAQQMTPGESDISDKDTDGLCVLESGEEFYGSGSYFAEMWEKQRGFRCPGGKDGAVLGPHLGLSH